MIHSGPVYTRPDFPCPCAGAPEVVGQIVKLLVIDRVDHGRIQQVACDPGNPVVESPAVPPADDGLKALARIDNYLGAVPETSSQDNPSKSDQPEPGYQPPQA